MHYIWPPVARRAALRARQPEGAPRSTTRDPSSGHLRRGLADRLPLGLDPARQQQSRDEQADAEQDRREVERRRVAVDRGGRGQPGTCPRGWRRSWTRTLAKIVESTAVPTAPPTCWQVLTIAEATPAS